MSKKRTLKVDQRGSFIWPSIWLNKFSLQTAYPDLTGSQEALVIIPLAGINPNFTFAPR